MAKELALWHNHTDYSNLSFKDSINGVEEIIDRALELDLGGLGITEHGNLSSHVRAIQYLDKLKSKVNKELESDPYNFSLLQKKNKLDNFRLGLGIECYLVDRDIVESLKSQNERIKFYHFILLPKDLKGYRALAKLSGKSWEESFYYRGMERIPTYKDVFKEIVSENKGHIIGSTACLGSEFSSLVLKYINEQNDTNRINIMSFVKDMKDLLGDDFYIEIQPSHFEEQISVNKVALQVAEGMGVKVIVTTDAHYLSKEDRIMHERYLKSQNAERETDAFYSSTYLMNIEELRTYFPYLDDTTFDSIVKNTIEVRDKITNFDLKHDTMVPMAQVTFDKEFISVFESKVDNKDQYPYICKYLTSPYEVDRIFLQHLEKGMANREQPYNSITLGRINEELESLWEISEKLNQRLSSYYLLTEEIVNLMWTISLVGISRGSGGAFYCNYLLSISELDSIKYDLPSFRHISKERPELPDIDIDTEAGERANILELIKEKYGRDRVLNIATFKTEGTKSAIQSICRAMDIPVNISQYLSSLVVMDGSNSKSIQQCIEEYSTNRDCKILIDELMAYDGLVETVVRIEGKICGRGIHASGVYIFPTEYYNMNSLMKAPNGQPITQYSMSDSDYQGGLKLDNLTIEGLSRIRKTMDLLIKENKIEWKGSLKETYNAILSPKVLEYDNEEMWKHLYTGEVTNAFQMETDVGKNALAKVQPHTLNELVAVNSLMRLSCDGEQPIDRFIRHKKDINIWYCEMKEWGLNDSEIELMKKHLSNSYGVATTQEDAMRLSMDVAHFSLKDANGLRKFIAKAKAKHLREEMKNKFYNTGLENGSSKNILDYVWEKQLTPMFGYSFSQPHVVAYSLILLQEMNLVWKFTPLYWKIACLSVNSGFISEDVTKSTDYGAIAKAICSMPKGFVLPPYINQASYEFKPVGDKAMYSLSAINGLGKDVVNAIIANRPYSSFEDFLTKCIDTKLVPVSKGFNLIKSGAFDEFNKDRRKVMMDYVTYTTDAKTKLTTSNINKLLEYNLIPQGFEHEITLYNFRKLTMNSKNLVSKDLYRIPNECVKYAEEYLLNNVLDAFVVDDHGHMCLDSKKFNKWYKVQMTRLNEWLSTDAAVDMFNNHTKAMVWNKYCSGSVEKWEMDALSYYTDKHELDYMPIENYIDVANFNELPVDPVVAEVKKWGATTYNKYRLSLLTGTVIQKDKAKRIITINTQYGVVDVKLDKGKFAHYDRSVDTDTSWFAKGTKVVVSGYRRGESFISKTYTDSFLKHSIVKIEGFDGKQVYFKMERDFVETDEF